MRFRLCYAGHNLELPPGQFLVGRSTECQLSIDDPLVSRKHARLIVTNDAVFIEDLGSRNGVLVDGIRIEARKRVQPSDKITIGNHEMFVADTLAKTAESGLHHRASLTSPSSKTVADLPSPNIKDGSISDETSVRKADAFKLLGGVADKAFAMGKAEEAERILQSSLLQILEGVRKKSPSITTDVVDQAGRYAARLAGTTGKGNWFDYVFEMYKLQQRMMPGTTIDELYTAVRKVNPINLTEVRGYLLSMKDQQDGFGPGERFLLQRLEGVERLAALR